MTSLFDIQKAHTAKEETVPCKWCGKPTPMLGTKECNYHWELRTKLQIDPVMARRMLKELKL
jgi:hypothetical protein